MLAVVITGPPGAGKTTVAEALHDTLGERGTANALVEADELARAYPPLPRDRQVALIGAAAAAYREAGHELLFVTDTLETDEWRLQLLDALDADRTVVVRLEAEPDTLARRVVEREPHWSGAPALAAHARELAVQMRELRDVALVLSTEDARAEDVAAAIEPLAVAER